VKLADFIASNMEPILAEWVTFAESSGPAGKTMDTVALRDHAAEMLKVIVADLRTPQTAAEQTKKSMGGAREAVQDTAAEVHGSGRAESGFSVGEMVSEYRALRASVIRLWTRAEGNLTGEDLEDLTRFNEAIDQALAESITSYTYDIDHSREMFVAILGHDLRTPLGTILMGSQHMLEVGNLAEPNLTLVTRIARSARRMNQMVEDLLDFTRGRLGSGVPVTRGEMSLETVVRHAIEELTTAHPQASVQFSSTGDLRGSWDAARIGQVVTNLLSNAVQHGAANSLITVTAQGEPEAVVLRVHNLGEPIPKSEMPGLFSPFKRVQPARATSRSAGNLGLGLYIAERVVTAHGGTISVRSSVEAGTLFTVRLPR
jgi:signal transduction histidine kinase